MHDKLDVLYLEDEAIVAADTSTHLQTLSFGSVHTAYRLADAVNLADQHSFDIAILDINVDRGQTSLELGRSLAEAGTHVIYASGNGSYAADLRSDGYGFIDKPFTLHEVTDRLNTVVDDLTAKAAG